MRAREQHKEFCDRVLAELNKGPGGRVLAPVERLWARYALAWSGQAAERLERTGVDDLGRQRQVPRPDVVALMKRLLDPPPVEDPLIPDSTTAREYALRHLCLNPCRDLVNEPEAEHAFTITIFGRGSTPEEAWEAAVAAFAAEPGPVPEDWAHTSE